jgi:putative DNA primase/helicase
VVPSNLVGHLRTVLLQCEGGIVSTNLINRDAALSLASMGLHVFACTPDKKPTVIAWEQNATDNTLKIEATWQSSPHLIPGLPVGAHGLVVIDCDRKPSAPDGVAAFHSLCAAHSINLSGAFVVETPSTGLHFYFRSDTAYGNSRGSLPAGIDVRGKGGYVIAPGAILPDGRAYKLVHGSWDAVPALPDALAALLRPKVSSAPAQSAHAPHSATERECAYAAQALTDEIFKLEALKPGDGRNHALNVAAHSMGTMSGAGWIDAVTVSQALLNASSANGHTSKHGEQQTIKTIESGLSAGMMKPREPLAAVPNIDISAMIANSIATYKRKDSQVAVAGKRSVTLVQCSTIEATKITWLWNGFIPQGKLTLLAGAGGTGKSTLAFSFAGTVSNGGVWPDGTRCDAAGNVLIWSSEDDAADTIVPRLLAVGANLQRCGIISGAIDENGLRCPFDAARDMARLREAINHIGGVSLLIIDPIVTAVTGDMHKANDVRRDLQPIVDFAAETNCAVFGITHFAKGTAGKNSAERVIGSQAFAALARMVLVAAKEEDSQNRVFTRAKSNNSVDTGGFSYTIEAGTLPGGIEATRVAWGATLEGSSREILSTVEEPEADDTSKMGQAKRFILEALSSGPVESKELAKTAREGFGISERTLRRAGEALGIKPKHEPLWGGKWSWALPLSEQMSAAKN